MNIHNDVKEILFSEEEINARCKELGEQLNEYYKDKTPPVAICLLKGSIPFTAELIKRLNMDIDLDVMIVSSYCGTNSSCEVKIKADTSLDLTGRNVLLIEDIIDTGRTIQKVKEIFQGRKVNDLKVVTLLDKPERREVDIKPDFCGFTIPDAFVIGFGLDYNQKYRNLPYIGIIADEAI